jgi:rhamnulokinase
MRSTEKIFLKNSGEQLTVKKNYAAIDLGAESGRIIVGNLSSFDIVHRFPNYPVTIKGTLYWDILGLFNEIKKGLQKAFSLYNGQIKSIGIDTWGVDYALLDKNGDMIANPIHYRDKRTDGIPEEIFQKIPRKEVFAETGIQFMQINTLYQLYAHKKHNPEIYDKAKSFVTIPDLLAYWLTGIKINEYSNSTTTQIYNPSTKNWSGTIIEKCGLNRNLFGPVVMPGAHLGPLLREIAAEINAPRDVSVIVAASHDTASAVTAVPAVSGKNYAYLSSGTWSLLGVEVDKPIINDKSYDYNFTNEGSSSGTTRFLKNIMGLWIIQQCRAHWEQSGKAYSYAEIATMAEMAGPAKFTINPNDPLFFKPGSIDDHMVNRIKNYCAQSGQYTPVNEAEVARGVFESLARAYATTIQEIEDVTKRTIEELFIIGGGSQNILLCKLTAQATGIPVFAGPVEATAMGNIMVQMIASGELSSIKEGREALHSFTRIEKYEPER